MSDKTNDEFDETVKEAQEEFDLDKRIQAILSMEWPAPGEPGMPGAIKDLLRDFSKYVTPEQPKNLTGENGGTFFGGFTYAQAKLEANTRKVLGDEH